MGIPGLWKLLGPSANTHDSFTSLTVREGFNARPQERVYRLGIDASIWIRDVERAFVSGHAQSGHEPELRTLLWRLARLLSTCTKPIFVFDGPARPKWKRGKRVSPHDHWLVEDFEEFICAFGFIVHKAPAEAEAELARMNELGIIDAILTEDSDAFVFGARTVIRNTTYKDNYKGHVSVFTTRAIEAEASTSSLTRGGLLLIALLCGGDYDKGIQGCGIAIAHALAQYGFGDTLFRAATTLTTDEFAVYISKWRTALRSTLSQDPKGILGRRYRALAQAVGDGFPQHDILQKLVHPIISDDTVLLGLKSAGTHLRIDDLTELTELRFRWGKEKTLSAFRNNIWAGIAYREMLQTVVERDSSGPMSEVITPYTGMLSGEIKAFVQGAECRIALRNGMLNHLIDTSLLGLRGICSNHQTGVTTKPAPCETHSVLLPSAVVERAWPDAVASFRGKGRRQTRSRRGGACPSTNVPLANASPGPSRRSDVVVIDLTEDE